MLTAREKMAEEQAAVAMLLAECPDLTFDEIRMKLGFTASETSDALYGLVNIKGEVTQSSRDLSQARFRLAKP